MIICTSLTLVSTDTCIIDCFDWICAQLNTLCDIYVLYIFLFALLYIRAKGRAKVVMSRVSLMRRKRLSLTLFLMVSWYYLYG